MLLLLLQLKLAHQVSRESEDGESTDGKDLFQAKREALLAVKLVSFLKMWVADEKEQFSTNFEETAEDLVNCSFGPFLGDIVGFIYRNESEQTLYHRAIQATAEGTIHNARTK